MTGEELTALVKEYAVQFPPKQRIPQANWEAYSEQLIREVMGHCQGKPWVVLTRSLLQRVPFFRDEPAFKSTWYRVWHKILDPLKPKRYSLEDVFEELEVEPEIENTVEIVEPAVQQRAISQKPIKPVFDRSVWAVTAEAVLGEVLANHPEWNRSPDSIPFGGVHYKLVAMFQELEARVPFWDLDSTQPEGYVGSPGQWRQDNLEFREIWFEECHKQMGFEKPKTKYVPPVKVVAKPKSRQLTMF
jgi:hypothetical protein